MSASKPIPTTIVAIAGSGAWAFDSCATTSVSDRAPLLLVVAGLLAVLAIVIWASVKIDRRIALSERRSR